MGSARFARLVLMIDRLLALLLLAGCVALGTILFAEFQAQMHPDSGAVGVSRFVSVSALQHGVTRFDEQVETVLARPLFSPARRPLEAGGSDFAAESGLENLRLAGVITTPGRRLAIFAVPDGRPLAVSEGHRLKGWKIERIMPRQVSMRAFGEDRMLHLRASPASTDAVQPPKLTFDRVLPDQETRDDE